MFKPRSIVLIGASKESGSIGAILAENLFNSGFDGPIMPIHPEYQAIEGVLAYPDVESLPLTPDLAVIASPLATVPGLIDSLGRRGTRAAILISAGSTRTHDAENRELQRTVRETASAYRMRVIGPASIGVSAPAVGLNASFSHISPSSGHLAFIAQSGTIVTSVLDWASARRIGFSLVVSLGDKCDVDFGDMLDYLATDIDVRGILLYVESIASARKFMSAARLAARIKPVIVIKSGRHAGAAPAVVSHTGAMAGVDAVYDAAFRRAGMLRVFDIGDLFGAIETLGMRQPVEGDRLAILTNGGGVGVMAVDALLNQGGHLATLAQSTVERLNLVLRSPWSGSNPVDIGDDASIEQYTRALTTLMADPDIDAILVLYCPTAVTSGTVTAEALVETIGKSRRTVLTCWLGERAAESAREIFDGVRIPTYFTPERAVRAFMDMVHYQSNQDALTQTPPSIPGDFVPDSRAARQIIDRALAEGRTWLSEADAKALLQAYCIPVVPTHTAVDPAEVERLATAIEGPVVIKILSPNFLHKSDVGGVVLGLDTPQAAAAAAEAMLSSLRERWPEARIEGFSVQAMVSKADGIELIVGMTQDRDFGPVLLFGHGGTATEIIGDTVIALPPLNMHLARSTVEQTRAAKLLKGYRDHPPAAIDDVASTLVRVSQLVIDFGEVAELDINPLLANGGGVIALDARVRIEPAREPANRRLAIRPYPKEMEEMVTVSEGRTFMIRPVLPEDEPAFHVLFSKLSQDSIRMRFFTIKKSLSHPFAARMTQIDYDREMALVLTEPGVPGRSAVFGTVHLVADADGERAEYAILIRSDMMGCGLGPLLMRRIIDYGRKRGLREIFGDVLRENRPMLTVCERLGFTRHIQEEDPAVVEVRLRLDAVETAPGVLEGTPSATNQSPNTGA